MTGSEIVARLELVEKMLADIRIGVGLTATTPMPAGHKQNARTVPSVDKALLKANAARELARALNRSDFVNYIKL